MSFQNPQISVIVPVFRVSSFIERSLESLLNQSFREFELILVDDCGGDDSIAIAEKLLKGSWLENSFKIIRNEVNLGVSASRGRGMDASVGSYIIHLDSDDYFEPDLLETLFKIIKDTDSDLAICGYIAEEMERSLSFVSDVKGVQILHNDIERVNYLKEMLSNRVPSALWNKLASRELYLKGGISFSPDLRDDLSLSPLLIVNAEKIAIIDRALIHYVMYNSSSVSVSVNHLNLISSTLNYLEEVLPSKLKLLCKEELLLYKVRTRRRLILHQETKGNKLPEILKLFPEVNQEILNHNNPEEKFHYRLLATLSARGDSYAIRVVRWFLRAIILKKN
ncbi:MAG: glycosyltransferase family 2 protein [Bacteroidales bacterium]|jgi:glycosyltransferase involved in cell wall biosynthesis|nr:glycosyltransferase family 2 protein [Bacteroidales bacterium]